MTAPATPDALFRGGCASTQADTRGSCHGRMAPESYGCHGTAQNARYRHREVTRVHGTVSAPAPVAAIPVPAPSVVVPPKEPVAVAPQPMPGPMNVFVTGRAAVVRPEPFRFVLAPVRAVQGLVCPNCATGR